MFTESKKYELNNDWSFCLVGPENDVFILQSKEGVTYAFDTGYGNTEISLNGKTYNRLHFVQEIEISLVEGGTFEERKDQLTEIFYEEGNHQLEDPIIFDGEEQEEDVELSFDVGNESEFTDLIQLCLLSDFKVENEVTITINSSTDDDSGSMEIYEGNVTDQKTINLIDSVIDKFNPYGYATEYNDGAYNRRSGYSKSSRYIEIHFDPAKYSNHQRLESVKKLEEKLLEYGITRK